MSGSRARRPGYTMMELMVVIAIIGVMTGVGLGAFLHYGRGNELGQGAAIVKTVLAAGRQASITRGVERRVAIDLRNEQMWLEKKIDEGRGKSWTGNSIIAGEIVHMPRRVDIADVNCSLGLLHSDDTAVFPANLPAAIFYVVFNPVGNVSEISAGNRTESSQTSFTIHVAATDNPIPLNGRNVAYNYDLINSGQLASLKGKVGINASEQDAAAMLARGKVQSITVLGNTGRIKIYPYGKNDPWSDDQPTGVYR